MIRFVGLFVGLLLLFNLAYYELITDNSVFHAYLTASAHVAAAMLRLVDEQVSVSGNVMTSTFSMSIKRGCDGLQAMAILFIGVIAFPVSHRKKWWALAAGAALLLSLNLVRIATLFWVGAHHPTWFEALHLQFWPAFLVFVGCAFWVAWVTRVVRTEARS